ncbi:MAG TPA: WYL domain-containing protein, partial [Pirellulales bacterium]
KDETAPSVREVEPYALVYYRGSLYLVALPKNSPPNSEYRHYKLDRFRKATALDDYFSPRPDFDAEKHFSGSLGIYKSGKPQRFEIRLADDVVAWVSETPWHPTQSIERRKLAASSSGSGDSPEEEAVLILPAAYEEEIIPRVLSLGEAAEILAPEPSRLAIQQLVSRLDRIYSGSSAERAK